MRVDAFDFDLPEERIALRPANPRDSARLMVLRNYGEPEHKMIRDLPDFLHPGDVIVVNDTKVFPARLKGQRLGRDPQSAGAGIEIMLHKRIAPSVFRALARPAKRLKPGDRILLGTSLEGMIRSREGGEVEVEFAMAGSALDAAISIQGEVPLPPYIAAKRKTDARDVTDYQTIYAREPGSVAAPTAGFHFTPVLLSQLGESGITLTDVTLHVGVGTFLPVSVEDTKDHNMHAEWAELSEKTADALNQARAAGRRIVAVGTTALRTIESAADDNGVVHPFRGETALFVTPGYKFKAVDVLLTNFHLPRSTLFMLVCAFSGTETMRAAYAEAIAAGYRFYSYGDACLLFRSIE